MRPDGRGGLARRARENPANPPSRSIAARLHSRQRHSGARRCWRPQRPAPPGLPPFLQPLLACSCQRPEMTSSSATAAPRWAGSPTSRQQHAQPSRRRHRHGQRQCRFRGGRDTIDMRSGTIAGSVDQGAGADLFTISGGTVTGNVQQGVGIDDFRMTGGIIQSLSQGDNLDTFFMSAGRIVDVLRGRRPGRHDRRPHRPRRHEARQQSVRHVRRHDRRQSGHRLRQRHDHPVRRH